MSARIIPLLVVLGLVAAVFDAGVLAVLVLALLGLYFFIQWWLRRVPAALTYRRLYDTHIFYGEQSTVTLELTNKSALAIPWVQFTERLPLRLGYPAPHVAGVYLPGRSTRRLTYTVRGSRRGYYALGPLSLAFGDVFGFEDRLIRDGGADRLVVYPKIVPLSQLLLPSRTPLGPLRSKNPLSEDPVRIVGVREYRRGDSMRQVHWPASARTGQLQVKKLEPAMSLQTVVALDLHPSSYEEQFVDQFQELAIVAAASVSAELVGERQAVGLVSNGADPLGNLAQAKEAADRQLQKHTLPGGLSVASGRGRGHLIRLLETLARIESSDSLLFPALLRDQMRGLGWGTTVVVITGAVTPELLGVLTSYRRAGYTVFLLVVGQHRVSIEEHEKTSGGLTVFRVREDRELPAVAEVLRG